VELAFASAAAAVVVVGLGVELRLLRPAPRRGEAIVWSIGWLLRAVAVAVAIALSGGPPGEWFTDDFRGRSDDGR
jgi:hypothetical protein